MCKDNTYGKENESYLLASETLEVFMLHNRSIDILMMVTGRDNHKLRICFAWQNLQQRHWVSMIVYRSEKAQLATVTDEGLRPQRFMVCAHSYRSL